MSLAWCTSGMLNTSVLCAVEGAVLVNPGGDRPGMVWLFVVMSWSRKGKVQPDGAHPPPGRTRGR